MEFIERAVARFLKIGMTDYCDIETVLADDDHTLVQRDGSLTTFLQLHGSLRATGEHREAQIIEQLSIKLAGIMTPPGFRVQFVLTRDPDANGRALKEALSPAAATAKRLSMAVTDLLGERARVLSGKVAMEHCFIAVTTQLSVFPPSQMKEALAERLRLVREMGVGLKMGHYGQSQLTAVEALKETHRGFLESFKHILSEFLMVSEMSSRDALRMLAFAINPSAFHQNWQPILPGDRVPVRLVRESAEQADISHLQYPDLGFQFFPQAPSIVANDPTQVQIGERYVAPIMVDIPPQRPQSFDELFRSIPREIPFRIMITLQSGKEAAKRKVGTKQSMATFLAFSSSQSRQIREAAKEIVELAESGHALMMASISFCTWGPDQKSAAARKAILMQAAQAWGNLQLIEERGDAIEAWLGTLPAMTRRPSGNVFPWFIEEAVTTLPLSRPASPWTEGSIMFRTIDNKPYPFQPGSSKQTSWVDMAFAPPGFGKSVFLAAQNLGLILSPGRDRLPRMAILDIGFSSAAFVDLVRQALPERDRHQAQAFKLTLSQKNAINPFDTPLGCRYPLAVDKGFLGNFLSLVLTPAGMEGSVPRLSEIVTMLIESLYQRFADDGEPNIYERGYSKLVDAALEKFDIRMPDGATWWQVVDRLFEVGDTHSAGIAQTFAVPLLSDATTVLSSDHKIRDVYGSAQINGESLINFLNGMIVAAVKDYPLLSAPTTFDPSGARVVSIDLQDVAKGGGDQANKRTAIVYMLARQATCREFYRSKDTLSEIPERYRSYHAAQIEADAAAPKKICMDEFHRTAKAQSVRDQAIIDIREGRKFGVHITILSQDLQDFSDEIVKMSNNVWILSKGLAETTTDEIQKTFKPSPDAMTALRRHVTGPGREGSTLLYLGDIKGGGRVEQVLRLTLGPREIWAYSTTAVDVALRGAIAEQVGLPRALNVLAERFPDGSAQSYLEQRGLESDDDEEAGSELIKAVARELVAEVRKTARG